MCSVSFAMCQELHFTEEQAFWQIALMEENNTFCMLHFNS